MEGVSGAEEEARERIIKLINESRTKIQKRYKSIKIAFNLTRLMQLFLVKEGYKGLGWNFEKDLCAIFGGMFLRKKEKSGFEKSLGYLNLIVRWVKSRELEGFHLISMIVTIIDPPPLFSLFPDAGNSHRSNFIVYPEKYLDYCNPSTQKAMKPWKQREPSLTILLKA